MGDEARELLVLIHDDGTDALERSGMRSRRDMRRPASHDTLAGLVPGADVRTRGDASDRFHDVIQFRRRTSCRNRSRPSRSDS